MSGDAKQPQGLLTQQRNVTIGDHSRRCYCLFSPYIVVCLNVGFYSVFNRQVSSSLETLLLLN